jgi:hypothetical protein
MSDNPSLGSRLKDDLLNNLSVSITAVVLAVLALGGITISDQVDGGLYLAMNIAVFLPYAYEAYWPVKYNPVPAVVWTISAALVTTGLYLGSYVLFERLISPEFVRAAAFIVTVVLQYGITRLYANIRNSA